MSATSVTVNTDEAAAAQAAERAAQAAAPAGGTPAGGAPARAAWLPAKFNTPEDLAKAYGELEKRMGSGTPAPAAPAPTVPTTEGGVDLNTFAGELIQKGGLSDASKTALKAKGLSESDVSLYADGLKARASAQRAELASIAGGDDALGRVYEWAQANMSADEVNAYNALINSGNIPAAKLSLQAIVGRYTAAVGAEPSLLNGEAATVAGIRPFGSSAEVVQAMRDPRYQNDPAYRALVERRMNLTQMNVRGK